MSTDRLSNDPEFISRFRAGKEDAFDRLFREYFAALSYFAYMITGDKRMAEDVVQDAFVLLWQRRTKLGHIREIRNYLYTIVRNECLKQKKLQHYEKLPAIKSDSVPAADQTIIAAEIIRELHLLINSLSPALQQVIRLYYLEGKSNQEIADQLGIEPDTVIRQRLRALLALRKTKISF